VAELAHELGVPVLVLMRRPPELDAVIAGGVITRASRSRA
jgi:endonuclease V-like protein UPF0215 family